MIYGGVGNDYLDGGRHNDYLFDEDGNDILIGGLGRDVLWGGPGEDRFVFNSNMVDFGRRDRSIDIIQDFNQSEGDKIVISRIAFGVSSTNQFSYDSNTGALFVFGLQFATLENRPTDFSVNSNIQII